MKLLATASSKIELIIIIEKYWACGEDDIIFLSELGHIKKNGRVMFGFGWRKKGNRYRLEASI